MKLPRGFSLTDLLVVLAVIVVIGALLMPRLLRSRLAAGEAAAIDSVRSLNTAEITYAAHNPDRGFSCNLGALAAEKFGSDQTLDSALASGSKNGYRFSLSQCSGTPATTYWITAIPSEPNRTGVRAFCSDQSGVIRFTPTSDTSCTDRSHPLE